MRRLKIDAPAPVDLGRRAAIVASQLRKRRAYAVPATMFIRTIGPAAALKPHQIAGRIKAEISVEIPSARISPDGKFVEILICPGNDDSPSRIDLVIPLSEIGEITEDELSEAGVLAVPIRREDLDQGGA